MPPLWGSLPALPTKIRPREKCLPRDKHSSTTKFVSYVQKSFITWLLAGSRLRTKKNRRVHRYLKVSNALTYSRKSVNYAQKVFIIFCTGGFYNFVQAPYGEEHGVNVIALFFVTEAAAKQGAISFGIV
jgi:hypothetical protein